MSLSIEALNRLINFKAPALDQPLVSGAQGPLICLEVNPPRGAHLDEVFARLEGNIDGLDLLNVTDSALARMKMAAIPFAALLKQRFGIDVVVNMACRDRNVIALQSDLLAANALGVRSIVALTGDAMSVGDMPESKGVFEVNSIGLLNLLTKLNNGYDLAGNTLKGSTDIVPGVVLNPNARNISAEIRRLEKKREAGARYALTQPVFDLAEAKNFIQAANLCGVPIMLGLMPLKNLEAARQVISLVPGIKISADVMEQVESRAGQDCSDFFLDHCFEIADALKGYVAGFHVVSGATPKLALKLLKKLVQLRG